MSADAGTPVPAGIPGGMAAGGVGRELSVRADDVPLSFAPGRGVRVLDADPLLAARVPAGERGLAAARLVARERTIPAGPWAIPDPETAQARGVLGLLVTQGVVAGATTVHGRSHAEVLGRGDLLQPWVQIGDDAVLVTSMSWRVHAPLTLLVLDRTFATAAAPWPEITSALMNRLVLRARRLSFQMAVSSMPRTTDRVLLMLWHFADRWGTVTPDGVLLELPLTHTTFASVVGTRRPSFTAAVTELRDSGCLTTPSRREWLLRPPAPATFDEIRTQVGLASAMTAEL